MRPQSGEGGAGSRKVRLFGRELTAAVHDRAALIPGAEMAGPAIVDQMDTTTWIPKAGAPASSRPVRGARTERAVTMATHDAIGVEVFANLFKAVVDEMAWVVLRSSHTTLADDG